MLSIRHYLPLYVQSSTAVAIFSKLLQTSQTPVNIRRFLITLLLSGVKANTGARALHSCFFPLDQPPTICPFSYLYYNFQETSQNTTWWLGFYPIVTNMPDSPLMLWNRFIDFAVKHWFGCGTIEPGYDRDVGAIEFDWFLTVSLQQPPAACLFSHFSCYL